MLLLFSLICYGSGVTGRAYQTTRNIPSSGGGDLLFPTLTIFSDAATVAVLPADGKQRMCINEVSGIGDAIFHLSGLTQRRWSEAEFVRELIRLRLPLYAVAPSGHSIVSRERVDGRLVVTPRPDLKADYVTLLQDEIEQLSMGGQTITDHPAWVFGDEPYRTWSEIEAHRAANHRVIYNWDIDPGEWMGESDVFFFAQPIGVTPDTTLVVPRCTIAELVNADNKRLQATKMPSPTNTVGEEATQTAGTRLVAEAAQDNTDPEKDDAGTGTSRNAALRGITKDQVLTAFGPLTDIDLSKALANGKGLYGKGQAKVISGTQGSRHAALWDPVILAVGFYENYRTPRAHLNRIFNDNHFLTPWWEEWKEQAEDLT